jgi:CBS domain-containing protein
MARLTREHLRHLVVLDGERILGVVSAGDVVEHRLEELETEAGVLRDYVAAGLAHR